MPSNLTDTTANSFLDSIDLEQDTTEEKDTSLPPEAFIGGEDSFSSVTPPTETFTFQASVATGNPKDVFTFSTSTPEYIKQFINNKEREKDANAVLEGIKQASRISDEAVQEVLSLTDEIKSMLSAPPEPDIVEQAYVDTLSDYSIDELEKAYAVRNLRASNLIQDYMEEAFSESSGFSRFLSLSKNIINPAWTTSVVNKSLLETMGKDPSFFEGRLGDTEEILRDFADFYVGLEPKDKEAIIGALYDKIKEESSFFGNPDMGTVAIALRKIFEASATENAIDGLLDIVDIITLPGLGAAISGVKDAGSAAITAAKLGKKEVAGNSVAADIVAKTTSSGLDDVEQVSETLSFGKDIPDFEHLDARLEGFSPEVKEALAKQTQSQAAQNVLNFKAPSEITPEEINNALAVLKETKYDHPYIVRARFDDVNSEGYTLNVLYKNPEDNQYFKSREEAVRFIEEEALEDAVPIKMGTSHGRYAVKQKTYRRWTYDEFGPIVEEEAKYLDPLRWVPGIDYKQAISKDLVDARVWLVHQGDKLRQSFSHLMLDAYKGTSVPGRIRVTKALKASDKQKTVFDEATLSGLGLKPAERIAYYKVRNIRDMSYVLHDRFLTDRLAFYGWKKIEGYTSNVKINGPGKVIPIKDAISQYKEGNLISVLDASTGQRIDLTEDILKEIQEEGTKDFIRIMNPVGDYSRAYNVVLVPRTVYKMDQFTHVLPYRPGEVPRIYLDPYFIRYKFKGEVNGIPGIRDWVIRTASTKGEAKEITERFNKALDTIKIALKEGPLEGDVRDLLIKELSKYVNKPEQFLDGVLKRDIPLNGKFEFKFDREMDQGALTENRTMALISSGRLFEAGRGEGLLHASGEAPDILDPIHAIMEEVSFVSRHATLDRWTSANIQRWLKAVGPDIESRSSNPREKFFEGKLLINDERRRIMLERARDYIKNQIGVPTKEDLWISGVQRVISESLEGIPKVGKPLSKIALRSRDASLIRAVRAFNFHAILGLMNIQQLLVQASGTAIAVGVHPVLGLKAAKNFPLYRMALSMEEAHPAVYDVIAEAAKRMGLEFKGKADFKAVVQGIKDSGILDSINSTAYYDAQKAAISTPRATTGYIEQTAAEARKILNTMTFFFDRGEEFMRVTAWDIARRELSKKFGWTVKDLKNPEVLRKITARMDDYIVGMTTANRARWQQGVLSIPLQFIQYPIKLSTSLLSRNTFTRSEKARIILTQILLYGSPGIPILGGSWVTDLLLGDASEEEVADAAKKVGMSPQDFVQGLTQGGLSLLLEAISGDELATGTRLGQGWGDAVRDLFKGRTGALEFISGPTGHTLPKSVEIYKELTDMFTLRSHKTKEDYFEAIQKVLEISSTWSNATKWLIASNNNGWLTSSKGQKIVHLDNSEMIWRAFGFKTIKEQEIYHLSDRIQDYEDALTEVAKQIAQLRLDKMVAIAKGHTQRAENIQEQLNALLSESNFTKAQWNDIELKVWKWSAANPMFDEVTNQIGKIMFETQGASEVTPSTSSSTLFKENSGASQ